MRRLVGVLAVCVGLVGGCLDDNATLPQAPPTPTTPPAPTSYPSVPRTPCGEVPCAHPPEPPEEAPQASGPPVHFAWTRWFLGSGGKDLEWADVGYDLDGFKFAPGGYDHCRPRDGAKVKNVVQDGALGEDNSFGRNGMPILLPLDSDAPAEANDDLANGKNGLLLTLDALGPEADQLGVTGRLHRSTTAPGGSTGVDPWWVASPDTELFGYVRGGVLVLHGTRAFVQLPLLGSRLWLPVRALVVTAKIEGGKLTSGRIAGVLRTEELVSAAEHVGRVAGYCTAGIQGYLDQTAQTADLPLDGNHDPMRDCDATSIGLGFEAAPAKVAGDVDLAVLVPVRCDGSTVEGFGAL